jgi:hypothetical protein
LTRNEVVLVAWCYEPDTESDPDRLAHPNLLPPRSGSTKSSSLHSPRSFGVEAPSGGLEMEMLLHCCAGLDVHKKTVVACFRRITDDGRPEERICHFGTTTTELARIIHDACPRLRNSLPALQFGRC